MDYDRLQTCVLTLSEPGPGALPMGGIKLSFKSSVHAHAHRLYYKTYRASLRSITYRT